MITRKVELPNFLNLDEAKCNCDCGKDTSPTLLIKVQCLIFRISQKTGRRVRCIVTSGARCEAHNTREYNGEHTPSYHMGLSKKDEGAGYNGIAMDVVLQFFRDGKWEAFDKEFVAKEAISMGVFGGVGWKMYAPGDKFVHLDEGPVRTF